MFISMKQHPIHMDEVLLNQYFEGIYKDSNYVEMLRYRSNALASSRGINASKFNLHCYDSTCRR